MTKLYKGKTSRLMIVKEGESCKTLLKRDQEFSNLLFQLDFDFINSYYLVTKAFSLINNLSI